MSNELLEDFVPKKTQYLNIKWQDATALTWQNAGRARMAGCISIFMRLQELAWQDAAAALDVLHTRVVKALC
jgi:hypothetical protein